MKEVLSSSEVETLLQVLSKENPNGADYSKELNKTSIKKYDFRRPNKFSKDQLRTLHMIHEDFSRMLSNFLSGYLRASISIGIDTIDQLTYEDFLQSISSPTLLTIFRMHPLTGSAVIESNHNFTFPIIDLLFGGSGKKADRIRELTDIELSVLKKLTQKILENMAYAWRDVFKFTPQIDTMETNSKFNQIISPNETIAIVRLITKIGDNEGKMNICLPFITLKDVISKLAAHYWFASEDSGDLEQIKSQLVKRLGNVSLTATAICGETDLTVKEFLELNEGNVIVLDKKLEEDMELVIEGHPKYKVQSGTVNKKLAVQITEKIQEDK